MAESDQPAGVAVDRVVRPVAEVCAGSLRWHIPMPDHVPKAALLSGIHYLYDQAALDADRERSMIALREWAVSRWRAEVQHRPLVNKHRRTLDDCWRQVMMYAGLDPDAAVGPSHDALLAASQDTRSGVRGPNGLMDEHMAALRKALGPNATLKPLDPLDVEEMWDQANADERADEVHHAFARLVERAHGIGPNAELTGRPHPGSRSE